MVNINFINIINENNVGKRSLEYKTYFWEFSIKKIKNNNKIKNIITLYCLIYI